MADRKKLRVWAEIPGKEDQRISARDSYLFLEDEDRSSGGFFPSK